MTAKNFYHLYYFENNPRSAFDARLKKIRFESLAEAVDSAVRIESHGELRPIEIRDARETLVTCAKAGWETPLFAMAASRTAQSSRRPES